MASVRWHFGDHGCSVHVRDPEGHTSTIESRTPISEFNIFLDSVGETVQSEAANMRPEDAFNTHHGAQVINTAPPGDPNNRQFMLTYLPVKVRAEVSFADEGVLEAEWLVEHNNITGKGSGKGLGKGIRFIA